MDRRAFFKSIVKHLPKAAGGTMAAGLAVLQWRADSGEKQIEKLDSRVRELESYSSATVAQVQILLSERKA